MKQFLEQASTHCRASRPFSEKRDYLSADIANWCSVRPYKWSGIEIADPEHLKRWRHQIHGRPLVEVGFKMSEDPNQVASSDDEAAKRFGKNALRMVFR